MVRSAWQFGILPRQLAEIESANKGSRAPSIYTVNKCAKNLTWIRGFFGNFHQQRRQLDEQKPKLWSSMPPSPLIDSTFAFIEPPGNPVVC
jgi:hypothetical protein